MRTPEEIAETGAAWISEAELAQLVEELLALRRERDVLRRALSLMRDDERTVWSAMRNYPEWAGKVLAEADKAREG